MKKKKSPAHPKKKSPAGPKVIASRKKKPTVRKSNATPAKQQEAEARKVHDLYWESYLVGDIDTLASLLDAHYTQIGSVENEVFFNKKDAVKFVKDTIDQVSGNVQMRNRITKAEAVDGFILFNEQCDLYVLIDGVWAFYSKFRATSLMQKTVNGWKMIHQHSSVPDLKAQEGENIAIEKISAENLQLRDAVKRRTVELEQRNRELEIEAALEKVRARTMAMQNSDELADVATIVFKQLYDLGIKTYSSGFNIWEENDDTIAVCWMSGPDGSIQKPFSIPYTEDPFFKEIYEAKQNGKDFLVMESGGASLAETYRYMFNLLGLKEKFDKYEDSGFPTPTFQITHCVFFQYGYFMFITLDAYPEAWDIFKRFGKVFEQTYTRFLDLQKAEAQAREAQIQLSLERVRARAMAMHDSNELFDLLTVLIEQFDTLGICPAYAHLSIINEDTHSFTFRISGNAGKRVLAEQILDIDASPVWRASFDKWKKGAYYSISAHCFPKETLTQTWELVGGIIAQLPQAFRVKIEDFPNGLYITEASCKFGFLGYGHSRESNQEEKDIIVRFVIEFERLYQRFLDLQKAEAQAREATIEAALEKVRGKAMAMRSSNDLLVTASEVFTEVRKLGIKPIRSGVGLLSKDSKVAAIYRCTSSDQGDELLLAGTVAMDGHPVMSEIYDCTHRGEASFPVLKGELLRSYYEKVIPDLRMPLIQPEHTEYGYFLSFTEGFFYGWSDIPIPEENIKILNRFKSIVDLTFRRYFELQKAEDNAREAIRQSALDRVRAETASMRTTGDLERITPLMWNELKTLGVPFTRCGVFIIDEPQEQIHTFLSTPEGKAITSFHLSYHAQGAFMEIVKHWEERKIFTKHWGEAEFGSVADALVNQGTIANREQYLSTVPSGLFLHCLPFLQGMLYVGNTARISDDELHLAQTLADAFANAYARYEDFNKLEEANIKIEKTLVDLKATQSLLVQSEKMASLGELTAGIAHEIQNPLNFVNNFSEVNTELLAEMKVELEKGNLEEVKALANDIIDNEQKINYHGKRAGGIVSGMMQHSRTSTGKREPTNINALADEYLRLAYHGLRAKDKSFNAEMKTDFDESLGNINVVPQDIGRVILNLINNAFYAVTEKAKQNMASYEPTVTVTTKKEGNKVLISVKDNGNGIPQKILDKIFQPFFTTKPTGQGTGLGLSLSYDIVKAHGGELSVRTPSEKVETREGQGSEFIIQLPV